MDLFRLKTYMNVALRTGSLGKVDSPTTKNGDLFNLEGNAPCTVVCIASTSPCSVHPSTRQPSQGEGCILSFIYARAAMLFFIRTPKVHNQLIHYYCNELIIIKPLMSLQRWADRLAQMNLHGSLQSTTALHVSHAKWYHHPSPSQFNLSHMLSLCQTRIRRLKQREASCAPPLMLRR